jgi:hypothetical protein
MAPWRSGVAARVRERRREIRPGNHSQQLAMSHIAQFNCGVTYFSWNFNNTIKLTKSPISLGERR